MANQLYSNNSSYGAVSSALLTPRSAADPYIPDTPYLSSSRLHAASDYRSLAAERGASGGFYSVSDRSHSVFGHSDGSRIGAFAIGGAAAGAAVGSGGTLAGSAVRSAGGVSLSVTDPDSAPWISAEDGVDVSRSKRSSEALYYQSVLRSHNTIGQSEAWLSTSSLAKRPRFETTSKFPLYPQRHGEKMCDHYMLTRTCMFGDNCKFDHPIWVPDGGIPDWKEVPQIKVPQESFPQRPGEPDCPYFLKTQKCKFGMNCKFNHPKENQVTPGNNDGSTLPERPTEPSCSYYVKTGKCKFGANCKFHHPKEIHISSVGQDGGKGEQTNLVNQYGSTGDLLAEKPLVLPAPLHNLKGLPIRLGEVDCPFYMKTGSCKYGLNCRYSHPEHNALNHPAAVLEHSITSPIMDLNHRVVNPAASMLQAFGSGLAHAVLGLGPTIYPQRPGEIECDYYMKTGVCKFGERCKFHHPVDRSAPVAMQGQDPNVKLTLAGLPRREGAVHCPFYMKTGLCKYGANCKFDHPTPGDVMAMAAKQGTSQSVEEEEGDKQDEPKVESTIAEQ